MPNYRRLFVPGGTFFFTVNLLDRRHPWLTESIHVLRAAYGYVQARRPFETVAICVLPEHLHCVWRLPPEDQDYPARWRLIKTRFSKFRPPASDPRKGLTLPLPFNPNRFGIWPIGEGLEDEEEAIHGRADHRGSEGA
jgi:REP element-mobilizing transposase RayT